MLSILTASTGPSAVTGSPVNGETSSACRGGGGSGLAGGAPPVSVSARDTASATAMALPVAVITCARRPHRNGFHWTALVIGASLLRRQAGGNARTVRRRVHRRRMRPAGHARCIKDRARRAHRVGANATGRWPIVPYISWQVILGAGLDDDGVALALPLVSLGGAARA